MEQAPDNLAVQEWLRRAADGDEEAWRHLIEAYAGRVFALVKSQCHDAELAEEITQSTFCTIVSKLASYTELGRFEPWLFRIAMNRLRDEMRRRVRHARPVESDTLAALAGGGDVSVPPDREDLGALTRALQQLSEADNRVVTLRHLAGMSFRQIADLLEEPLGTVLARQHRALRKLRDLIEAERRQSVSGESEGNESAPESVDPAENDP